MGLSNNLGKLSNMITSTGSAVGIAQPSPAYTLDVTGTGRFSGALNIGGNQTFTGAVGTTKYIITDETASGTGRLVIQAGGGSASFGGAINLYAASNPTYTGDVAICLSATTGAKFRVNSSALDGGTDLLTILRTGNVGINTTSPSTQLHIVGVAGDSFTDGIRVARNGTPSQYCIINSAGGTNNFLAVNTTTGEPAIYWNTSINGTSTTTRMTLNTGSYMLDVSGSIRTTSNLAMTGTSSQILQTVANSVAGDNVAVLYNSNANSYGLYIGAGSGTNHALYITDSTRNANLFKVQGNGNTGVGTGSPARKFVVQNTAADPFISILGAYPNQGGILFGDTTYTDASCAIRIDRTNNALWFSTGGASSERMRITANGNVAIGTTTIPSDTVGLIIGGTNSSLWRAYGNYSGGATGMDLSNSSNTTTVQFFGSSGNYYFAGTNISDRRSKTNIQAINNALSNLLQLKPSTFAYNLHPTIIRGGFIAQEVQEVIPDFVTVPEDETEMMGVDYNGILALAVKAIQELNERLNKAGL